MQRVSHEARFWYTSVMATNSVDMEPMECLLDADEENFASQNCKDGEEWFDTAVGHIEDIIMEEQFIETQNNFLEKYWHEFEDTEENKFIYTDIHKEYTELIERYIEAQLCIRMPDFSMVEFQKQLALQKQELEGEVFEILMTFSDFVAFKDMFLDFRAAKEGRTVDLSSGLTVTSLGGVGLNGCSRVNSASHSGLEEEEPMVEGMNSHGNENFTS